MFALALAGVLGGVWRGTVEYGDVMRAFARLGVSAAVSPGECVRVFSSGRILEGVDPIRGACLRAVGGDPVDPLASTEAIARRIEGPEGGVVTIEAVGDAGEPFLFHLTRTSSLDPPRSVYWVVYGELAGNTLNALLFVFAALLLRLRRAADPVSRRISFSFLALANLGAGVQLFWNWAGWTIVPGIMTLAGLTALLMVLPAFPDGRYIPRATRWLRLIAPILLFGTPFAVGVTIELFGSNALLEWLMSGSLAMTYLLGIPFLVLRYLKMPHGLERQKVKWAVFGLAAGLVIFGAVNLLPDPMAMVEAMPQLGLWIPVGYVAMTVLSLMLIPAGMLVSLMDYRLNDADAAISKSLGYAVVTLVVAIVWAISSSAVNRAVGSLSPDPMVATGLTTVIALLVFTPARTYVLGWTEKRFQRALVRLRALPAKLSRWQVSETPEELADAALADIVSGVGAAHAAILGDNGREWRVLAARGLDPETVRAELARERPADRRDDPFPIRVQLADQLNEPDLLAIGPRSDGASYTKDERSAIASIVGPLSDALQACARRERHVLAVANSLLGLEQRLDRLEQRSEG